MSRRLLGCLFELAETFAIGLVVILLIQYFAAGPYRIQQSSMEGTLSSGQWVLVDKLSPQFDGYHRGDIIVFDPPASWGQSTKPYVDRVIALGGDQVEIQNGYVFVNGVQLQEKYVFKGDITKPIDLAHQFWNLEPGQLFVLGDHRSVSLDSRNYGPIEKSSVIGRVLVRYWPLDSFELMPPAQLPAIPAPSPSPTR